MEDIEFLKEITDLPGGSGSEDLVRNVLKREISKITSCQTDAIGNVYGSIGTGPKVLAVGHMDEIGFMVRGITSDGYIQLGNVGFVFSYGILCQEYTICTNNGFINGIIGKNPDQGKKQGNEFPDVEDVLLDIGCKSKEEVVNLGIEIGNAVIAKSHFMLLQNNEILAKAWDNRIGCAISIRVMQELNKNLKVTFIGGGTVQEEVGCRGARALGINIKPDIAFSLDTSPASNEDGFIVGNGPQLFVMDSSTLPNKKLLDFVKKIAKQNNIPYQLSYLRRGGTDASEFQNISGGTPTLAIGIPVKYIHTPTSVISYNDYKNTIRLLKLIVEALDEKVIKEISLF
ncbi:MAG: M42 family metallopeptidase [Anaeroplasma sp.]